MNWRDLAPEDALSLIRSNGDTRLLDVRTPEEHNSHRLPESTLIPIQDMEERWEELEPDQEYLVYCEHGMRSQAACAFLEEKGFGRLINLTGGMAHWIGTGLDYER